jgi:ribosome-binding factor A
MTLCPIFFIKTHPIMPESRRQHKLAKQLQRDLGEIFLAAQEILQGQMVSVTDVVVSPALSVAKVYLSFFQVEEPAFLLALIQDKTPHFRNELAQRIRNQVRKIPELRFLQDQTAEEAERIEKLLSNLDIPPAPEEEDENTTKE